MTSMEKFSLKWKDFQENTTIAFNNLRDDLQFTDVTLVSEDGQALEAHKVILSASSQFFMDILKLNKHTHPLVYLKGFKAKELQSLLNYIYQGVASIYQDDLDLFLAKAEELQLKGLTGDEGSKNENETEVKDYKLPIIKTENEGDLVRDIPEGEWSADTSVIASKATLSPNVYFNGGTAKDLKSTIWSLIALNGTVLTCTVCGKTTDSSLNRHARDHMERHVESLHVDGVTYNCPRCDKISRSKVALQKHTQKFHNRQ